MKRSLRLRFTLLLLALLTLLSTRSTMLDSLISIPASLPKPVIHLNHTLLSLASLDSSEPQLKQQVHNLLNVIEYKPATHYLTRYRIPADRLLFTNFRSALLTWIHTRYFHAQIMSDLIRLVKRPIDVHFARPESEYTKPYPSCAVVGNSGILLKKENGDFIDGHDVVIRLNNAEIRSHAKHVGSKTNISFVNSNILHLCATRTGCFCHPYGKDVVIVMYICQPIHFFDFVNCNMLHKSPLLITDPRFDVMCARVVKYYSLKRFVEGGAGGLEEWGEVHDERMFHYSSGMQAVVMALGICERVSVFGFGKSRDVKHHYHTNQKAELGLHDYGAEYEFYRDLVERPEVIPFLNQSGFVVPPVVFYH